MTELVDRKICTLETLLQHAAAARAAGRRVVQCHGCFDLVHPGHIRYLRFARELGDVLIVSLTSDEGVSKGPERPYIPQELRAENLAALEFVDWVVIDSHPTAVQLLEQLRPDVYVKGREYAQSHDPRFIREREVVEQHGGRVVFHSGDIVFSSTRLMRQLDHDQDLDECRLRTLCERSGIDTSSAAHAVAQWADVRAVVVGDVIREQYISCDASEAADDAPVLSLHQLDVASYWGGAAAVVQQLRAFGASVVSVSAGTDDEGATAPLTDWGGPGVDAHILPVRREPLVRQTYVADDAKLFRVNAGVCHPLDTTWERYAAALIQERLADADLLILCDDGCGMITPGLVTAVTRAAREQGVIIAGHAPASRGAVTGLVGADLICATERRLRESVHDMTSSLPSVTYKMLEETHGGCALVALHKRGLIAFDGRGGTDEPQRLRSEFVPALAKHFVDLLGSEEARLVAAGLTLATKGSLSMAAYLASATEALSAVRPGRTVVSTSDLHTWLNTRPELRPQSRFLPDAATVSDIANLAPPLASEQVDMPSAEDLAPPQPAEVGGHRA